MCSWKPLEGQGWSPDHPEPIAPFPHSGLSCSSVNNKSMSVCAMYSIGQKEEICIYEFILFIGLFIGLMGLNMIKARSF